MLMGTTFGPMGALLPELFPTNVRYSGSAIAYAIRSPSLRLTRTSTQSAGAM